jgi:hypothetical protein
MGGEKGRKMLGQEIEVALLVLGVVPIIGEGSVVPLQVVYSLGSLIHC